MNELEKDVRKIMVCCKCGALGTQPDLDFVAILALRLHKETFPRRKIDYKCGRCLPFANAFKNCTHITNVPAYLFSNKTTISVKKTPPPPKEDKEYTLLEWLKCWFERWLR